MRRALQSRARSPFGAPPRRLLRPIAEARSGPRFTRCSAQALPRALASRLSEAPRAPVVMPAGSMPGPPGSGSDEPPPAGTAPAPSVGSSSGMTSLNDGRDVSAQLLHPSPQSRTNEFALRRTCLISRTDKRSAFWREPSLILRGWRHSAAHNACFTRKDSQIRSLAVAARSRAGSIRQPVARIERSEIRVRQFSPQWRSRIMHCAPSGLRLLLVR